jgi:hypothetical protein
MSPRAFKTDESFLEKISMGAIGTRCVYDNLRSQGHDPIELERGSMSYKIWRDIKIKRGRVPDILCIKCGNRIESRAKKSLEISMSHSLTDQNRAWDYELKDTDRVAFVECAKEGDEPNDWRALNPVQYVTIAEMRRARREEKTIQQKPKGVEEGSEVRLLWPSAIASSEGRITKVADTSIQFREEGRRAITLQLTRNCVKMTPLVKTGDVIVEGQIIASVVDVTMNFSCPDHKTLANYIAELQSPAVTDRYEGNKAY